MARTRKTRKQNKKQTPRRSALVRSIGARLDAGAQAWLKLLDDPCNAPLVPGCYAGMGSGMLYRVRTIFDLGASAVDGYAFFHPSGNFFSVTTPALYYLPIQWASSNTAGGNPATRYGKALGGLPAGAQNRCVAACMKLRYRGSELNRAGIVGTILTNDPPFLNGTPGGVADPASRADEVLQGCQTTYRLGETQHEVKWVPTFEDGGFIEDPMRYSSPGTGNAIGIVFTGVPAGSVYLELTSVYEVVPDPVTGLVTPERAPPSSSTLNDVLRAIGNVGKWATDPHNQRGMYNLVSGIAGTARAMTAYAPSVAGLLM